MCGLYKGVLDLKPRLDFCEYSARSFEILNSCFPAKQNYSTDREASVISLNFFETLLDFSMQHIM